MGKGGKTSQNNVVKRPAVLTGDKNELLAGAGVGGGSADERAERINQCMIKFTVKVADDTGLLRVMDKVVMIPEGVAGVQIIHQGRKVASYDGELAGLLYECMKQGYVYKGEVIDLSDGIVSCRIQGNGKL